MIVAQDNIEFIYSSFEEAFLVKVKCILFIQSQKLKRRFVNYHESLDHQKYLKLRV